MDYGTVAYQGKTFKLDEQPTYSNRVFPGWFGDAQEGEPYTSEFVAGATDEQGLNCRVYWQFTFIKFHEPEDLSDLDWSEPAYIRTE